MYETYVRSARSSAPNKDLISPVASSRRDNKVDRAPREFLHFCPLNFFFYSGPRISHPGPEESFNPTRTIEVMTAIKCNRAHNVQGCNKLGLTGEMGGERGGRPPTPEEHVHEGCWRTGEPESPREDPSSWSSYVCYDTRTVKRARGRVV